MTTLTTETIKTDTITPNSSSDVTIDKIKITDSSGENVKIDNTNAGIGKTLQITSGSSPDFTATWENPLSIPLIYGQFSSPTSSNVLVGNDLSITTIHLNIGVLTIGPGVNGNTLVIPVGGAGAYMFTATIFGITNFNFAKFAIRKNSTNEYIMPQTGGSTGSGNLSLSGVLTLGDGDKISIRHVSNTSGSIFINGVSYSLHRFGK